SDRDWSSDVCSSDLCTAVTERLFALLQSAHEDLARAARERAMITQFSDRLVQAFEETNLMFRVARMLNFESEPLRQLQATCSQRSEEPRGGKGCTS